MERGKKKKVAYKIWPKFTIKNSNRRRYLD